MLWISRLCAHEGFVLLKKHNRLRNELWDPAIVTRSHDKWYRTRLTLQWRHNAHDSVSNHQPHDCLLNHLFRRRSKKTSKFRVTGLCAGNSPRTGEFPTQMASNAEFFFHLMTSSWSKSFTTISTTGRVKKLWTHVQWLTHVIITIKYTTDWDWHRNSCWLHVISWDRIFPTIVSKHRSYQLEEYIDGLAQDCSIAIANALKVPRPQIRITRRGGNCSYNKTQDLHK